MDRGQTSGVILTISRPCTGRRVSRHRAAWLSVCRRPCGLPVWTWPFWAQERGQTKARVLCRWALPAVSWHVAARLGVWYGERAHTLPDWLRTWFSYQAHIKRQ